MFKTKLYTIICAVTSVAVAATTALTLAIAGPRNTQSLHMLSDNDAVTYGISNLVTGNGSSNALTNLFNTAAKNKVSIKGDFVINSIDTKVADLSELPEGTLGAGFQLDMDTENDLYALMADLTVGSVSVVNGTVYVDKDAIIAKLPVLFEGIISIPINNLENDIENSYVGKLLLDETSLEELKEEFALAMGEFEQIAESVDFDLDDFIDGLCNTIEESYTEAMAAASVDSLGNQKLNGGSYPCYKAAIPVQELSYIIRDAIVYILKNDDVQKFVDDMMAQSQSGMSDDMMLGGSIDLASTASMLESMWGQVVSTLESVLGKDIEITLYLTDSVQTAGVEFYFCVSEAGTVSYDKSKLNSSVASMSMTMDFTGGKNIGDYSYMNIELLEEGESILKFVSDSKMEADGKFSNTLNMASDNEEFAITADGSYTEDGDFFDYKVDSYKVIENNETLLDIGFSFSFKPIDKVEKPSGTPEYNIFEMNESDFKDFGKEIEKKLEAIEDLLN